MGTGVVRFGVWAISLSGIRRSRRATARGGPVSKRFGRSSPRSFLSSINPADGRVLNRYWEMSPAQLERTIRQVSRAAHDWREM